MAKISIPVSVEVTVDPSEGRLESGLIPESEKVLREELPPGVEGQHVQEQEIRFCGFQELPDAIAEVFSTYDSEYESVNFSISVKIMGTELNLMDERDIEIVMEEIKPETEMRRCPKCGHVSFDRSKFCSECGHKFRPNTTKN